MANTRRRSSVQTRRRWPLYLGLFVLALAAPGFYYSPQIGGYSKAGTAYAARVGCSCRFVGGRSLKDCAKDKLPGMELVTLVDDVEAKSVTARFPLIASDTATYRKGYGCVLEKWQD